MFSQVCVKNSVHRRGMHRGGALHGRVHAWLGGMCGRGMHGRGACMAGACMAVGMCGRGACVAGGMCVWQGGMHGQGVHGRGMCGGGRACVPGGCAWQERRPLQWTVRILLDCILVYILLSQSLWISETVWESKNMDS